MKNKRILASGVDSEYVLGDLCDYLRARGWSVEELDFGKLSGNPYEMLEKYHHAEAVYITSAHTNLSQRTARVLAPTFSNKYPNYLSPVEIIARIQPSLSIYVPHDLLTPYGDTNLNEYRFLGLFDIVMSPFADSALQATLGPGTQVIDAGWIKNIHPTSNGRIDIFHNLSSGQPRVALFVSMVEHLLSKYGVDGVVNYLLPLLQEHIAVKLPAWRGVDQLETALRQTGLATVLPAELNSTSLIQAADIVICNGASSIHAESALMGKATVCLLDNEGISASEQRRKLEHLPGVYFHDYRDRTSIPEVTMQSLHNSKNAMSTRTFDYDAFEKLIINSR